MNDNSKLTGPIVDEQIVIDADAEAVWQALTDASELTRWYPLEAIVKPGLGGSISFGWGDEYPMMPAEIITWKPGERLQLKFEFGLEQPSITDFTIESSQGKTTLRIVQSGFAEGEGWEDWFEATRAGWQFQLQSLAYYLAEQRGRERKHVWVRRPALKSDPETWSRIKSSFSIPDDLKRGDAYHLGPAGMLPKGRVLINDGTRQFAVSFGEAGILRVSIDPHPGGRSANAFFGMYQIDSAAEAEISKSLEAAFDKYLL